MHRLLLLSRKHWVIIVLLLFSLSVRLYKIDTNLPNTYWHDENNFVESALRFGTGDLKPDGLQHGMLLPLILFSEYSVYYLAEKMHDKFYTPEDFLDQYVKDPSFFYLISRITVSLFGTGCILLIYMAAIRLYNQRIAILSSVFFSSLLVVFVQSKWTKADMVSLFFLLLSLYIFAPLFPGSDGDKKAGLARYILGGFFIGLASAAKLYTAFGFSFIFFAHLWNYFDRKKELPLSGYVNHFFDKRLILSGVFVFAGFIAGNPYVAVNPGFLLFNISQMHNELLDTTQASPWLLYITDHLKNILGSRIMEILVLISGVFFIFKRSGKEIILFSYPVALYLLYMNYPGLTHYLTPAVPFLVIIASAFLDETLLKRKSRVKAAIATAVIFTVVYPGILNIFRFNCLISKPDTRTLAANWIEEHIPDNASILSEGYIYSYPAQVPQLKGNRETLIRDLELITSKGGSGKLVKVEMKHEQERNKDRRYNIYKTRVLNASDFKRAKYDYVLLSGYAEIDAGEREYMRGQTFYSDRKMMYQELENNYVLVKTFTPYPELGCYFPLFLIKDFKKISSIRFLKDLPKLRQGPEIRIYRIKYRESTQ